ncbi:Stk1 family PASTA domain-containing Ser/Thr kinase [Cumulibacter manganitolerans]|uniref:Stk1 family PASTA domain-containing Ser/Thr kinase n=1 Tax=Cumulibacter manganitolerans TaxID=1884992 RepID=UPI0012952096|nr:Stk1 family PASTA domain-containing Ser/Thr kinase [Cumulibacter manganitolerans]
MTRILGNRYEVGRLLGYGGMAEVLLARDTRLDRDVAIKILRSDLARDHTFQARFRREAQSAASLNHPAIVSVYDTGTDPTTDPPTPYIVMEFVEGQTLRELLRTEGTLEAPQAMRITAEICGALDFSHRNGIVHRDVKPGNVMITPAGRVKVMDFGIARAVSDTAATMTATAAVVGTAQYLSPEQARGESVDARSDVYAAGCVLYELLTGTPPFTGDSPVAVAYQHVREVPKLPSSLNPTVPRDLDSIVMKALSKNPANRYQSAAAMQDDLDRAIMGEKVQAAPVLTEEEATTIVPALPAAALPDVAAYGEEQDDRRRGGGISGRTWAWLAALLAAVVVAAFFVVPSMFGKDAPAQVTVPSVVNQSLDDATATLQKSGLKVGEVTKVTSSVEQTDKVVGQDPSAQASADKGSKVNLSVGAGPAQITVPDVTGKPQDEAKALIEAAGLKFSPVEQDNAQSAGTAISSSPKAGESAPEMSTVTVFISSGQVQVPSVIGKTKDDALQVLQQAGFSNVQVTEQDSNEPAGMVVGQDPNSGKQSTENVVTLAVSSGQVAVPSVVGKTRAEAEQLLKQAGFTPQSTEQEAAGKTPGTVISQNPASGKQPAGATIQLVIAKAPPATTTSSPAPPTTTSPPPASTSTPPGG